jgi:hypothetical protein
VAVAAGVKGAAKRASNSEKIAVYEAWMRTCAPWAQTTPDKTLGEFFLLNPVPLLLAAGGALHRRRAARRSMGTEVGKERRPKKRKKPPNGRELECRAREHKNLVPTWKQV